MERKDQIEQTVNVSENIKSVVPSAELMNRLRSIPDNVINVYNKVPKKVVWSVAASILILIAINAYSARKYSQNEVEAGTSVNYFDYLKHI